VVNLLVAEAIGKVSPGEILRVLVPNGVACLKVAEAEKAAVTQQLAACNAQDVAAVTICGESWIKFRKPRPAEIDEWTHFLHGPDNNAVANDTVVGMPRRLQWVGAPKWGRSHEELASMSGAVTTNGRLFYIVDEAPLAYLRFAAQWKLVGRDAFNGVVLWKRDVGPWTDHLRHFRSGPAHLARRLIASGDVVYTTLGLDKPLVAIDAATGKTLRTYRGTDRTEEILLADGVLYLVVGTSEGKVGGGGLHRRGEPRPTPYRYVVAMQADTGRPLWKKTASGSGFVLPLTLAVQDGRVYYQSVAGLVCVDAKSGKDIWKTPRPTPASRYGWSAPTLVVGGGVVLSADRDVTGGKSGVTAAKGPVQWGVDGWNVTGIPRKSKSTLRAYDAATGKELWSTGCGEGYNSPVDVFIAGGLVWNGPGFSEGRDLKTGETRKTIKSGGPRVGMAHHRCYRNKATNDFILTGKAGIEVVSLKDGWLGNNSWIRGTCQYGIMPANGLLYAPPNACACFPRAKLQGFVAVRAPGDTPSGKPKAASGPVLEKGPAFAAIRNPQSAIRNQDDWPTYRGDAFRSGTVSTKVPASLKPSWSVDIGGKLTQAVIADGTAFIASVDAHTVHALTADTGKGVWTYTAGGRIDSPPTVYKGRVYFGSADGWIYCLAAADGKLVWRFRAAPEDRLVGVFGQLESVWPVHGAVLIQNDTVYATAGRSTYLDGGIVLYGIDPVTGQQKSRTVLHDIDPATGKQTGAERGGSFDMEGTVSTVLSGDGESVFLKHLRFDASGRKVAAKKAHLFSPTGILGEEWFVRSYWLFGTEVGAGWGRWANVSGKFPFGRILCFDGKYVYGYGRKRIASAKTGHTADAYHFFCLNRTDADSSSTASATGTKPPTKTDAKKRRTRTKAPAKPAQSYRWTKDIPVMMRAMAVTEGHVIAAGVPDVGRKTSGILAFSNEKEAFEAFVGKRGGILWVVSATDGRKLFECKLKAPPVFDGMSAANGRVYLATRDGKLTCYK